MSESVALLSRLHWLGHDSFRIDGVPTVYFDPWNLTESQQKADVVLVSHEHYDHCSPDDVRRLSRRDTVVIANPSAAKKLPFVTHILRPGEQVSVGEVTVEAVPAYNVGKHFHPRTAEHCGFIVTIGGERVYFAGDTDHIPEMAAIRCDIALLPVGGTYTMDAREAALAAADIQPKVAIPMHWGSRVAGSRQDAERFRSLYDGNVVILEVD